MAKRTQYKKSLQELIAALPEPPRPLTSLIQWTLFLGDIYTRFGTMLLAISGLLYFLAFASGGLKKVDFIGNPLFIAVMSIPLDAAVVMTMIGWSRYHKRRMLLTKGLFADGTHEGDRPLPLWFPIHRWGWRRVYEVTYTYFEADGKSAILRNWTITPEKFSENMLILYRPGTDCSVLFGEPGLPEIPNGFPEINEDGSFKPNTEPLAVLAVLGFIILLFLGIFGLNMLFGK